MQIKINEWNKWFQHYTQFPIEDLHPIQQNVW